MGQTIKFNVIFVNAYFLIRMKYFWILYFVRQKTIKYNLINNTLKSINLFCQLIEKTLKTRLVSKHTNTVV